MCLTESSFGWSARSKTGGAHEGASCAPAVGKYLRIRVGVTRVLCESTGKESASLPNRGLHVRIHSPAPYYSYLGMSPNGGPARPLGGCGGCSLYTDHIPPVERLWFAHIYPVGKAVGWESSPSPS